MQKKHLTIATLICFGLINFSYTQDYEFETPIDGESTEYKTPENIAFVLLKLVNNEIKMEKYNNSEFSLATNVIGKQKSNKHCIMTINMKDRGLSPQTIEWDDDQTGKVDIIAGRNKNITYSMNLENIFKDSSSDVIAICFDCMVKRHRNKETKEWKSQISVILPIKVDNTRIEFIFDEKVKAACGFFMGDEDFEDLLAVEGTVSKKEALKSGLIYISSQKNDESTDDNSTPEETTSNTVNTEPEKPEAIVIAVTEPETTNAKDDIPNEATSEPATPQETAITPQPETFEVDKPQKESVLEENSTETAQEDEPQKPSTLSYIFSKIKDGAVYLKDAFVAKLIALKRIAGSIFGSFFRKK